MQALRCGRVLSSPSTCSVKAVDGVFAIGSGRSKLLTTNNNLSLQISNMKLNLTSRSPIDVIENLKLRMNPGLENATTANERSNGRRHN